MRMNVCVVEKAIYKNNKQLESMLWKGISFVCVYKTIQKEIIRV